jgi:transmembrane sensor
VTRRETSSEIDKAAAAWTACADRGPLSDAERRALDAWLDGDPRRRGAFARANAVMVRADLAGHSSLDTAYALRGLTDRRRLLIGGGVAAAFGGVAFVGVRAWSAPLILQSSKGEVRRVPLPDGSNVTLNTQSLVKVRYTRHSRAVSLASGEALFNVTQDGERPFIVQAGEVRLLGHSGSFTVRRDARGPCGSWSRPDMCG